MDRRIWLRAQLCFFHKITICLLFRLLCTCLYAPVCLPSNPLTHPITMSISLLSHPPFHVSIIHQPNHCSTTNPPVHQYTHSFYIHLVNHLFNLLSISCSSIYPPNPLNLLSMSQLNFPFICPSLELPIHPISVHLTTQPSIHLPTYVYLTFHFTHPYYPFIY